MLNLKETFMLKGEIAFNKEFNSINGLGRLTKALLLASFKNNLLPFSTTFLYNKKSCQFGLRGRLRYFNFET